MKNWKGTIGKWCIAGHAIKTGFGEFICSVPTWEHGEKKSNLELIADAGNTIQKCGKLPSELLSLVEYYKEKSELLEIIDSESPCDPDITEGQIKAYANYQKFLKANELINKITE